MKNILIVTDFSNAAQNAGRYGIELAKYFNAKVFLFNAFQVPIQVPESYLFYSVENTGEITMELLKKEAEMINPGNLVAMEICGAEGTAANAIISEATNREADMIICGMKSSVKTLRRIFGSTITTLASKSDIPLIVVPENSIFVIPKNIALANDMDQETANITFNMLKELGEKFISKLSVVWVVDDGVDGEKEMRYRPKTFINEFKDLDPVLEYPSGSNITKTIEGFIKEHEIDLLAIIPHKHDLLERFMTESITKNMIFHTEIPLLVLPQKKNAEMKNQSSRITEAQD
ncbi:MAG: universal stress protein [Ferruginibacter sp.]